MPQPATAPPDAYPWWRRLALVAGPALAAAAFLAPPSAGLPEPAWRLAGVAGWMVVWWLTEAVPIPATALVPLPVLPLAGIAPEREVAASYAHPLIFLFLGGFLLAGGIQRSALHRRIALGVVRRVGSTPAALVGGFMAATALLSMWISNTATAILMYTIALSVIALVEREGAEESRRFGRALMLGIAYAASIGGTATLIGTPTNALLASFLADSYGYTLDFRSWLLIGVPYAAAMLPFAWLWLTRVAQPLGGLDVARARRLVDAEAARLGPWSREERAVAAVFSATALGWIGRDLVAGWTGLAITDTTVAMTGGLALLVVPLSVRRRRFALDWETVEALPWGVLILFGGGLALAGGFQSSGLAAAIGDGFAGLGGAPAWALVAAVTAVVVALTELTSNTATAATFLPVAGAAAAGLGASPLLLTVPVALAASAAFMLPVATPPNAIVFAYRHLRIADMAKSGLALNLVAIAVITLLVLALGGPVLGID